MLIDGVESKDIGTYACNVSNIAGYDYKMVYLNILTQAPIFRETPRNRTVSIGMEVILRYVSRKKVFVSRPRFSFMYVCLS